MRTTAATSPKRTKSRPAAHRTTAARLDPYAVVGTVTLEEWRRTQSTAPAVHVVRHQEDVPTPD
jgi:hypothetical protein